MKKTKMSTRRPQGLREMSRTLDLEQVRDEMQNLEQQRIDFEHRAHFARDNLYGLAPSSMGRGWVDASKK